MKHFDRLLRHIQGSREESKQQYSISNQGSYLHTFPHSRQKHRPSRMIDLILSMYRVSAHSSYHLKCLSPPGRSMQTQFVGAGQAEGVLHSLL
jgi:hypothetical protein